MAFDVFFNITDDNTLTYDNTKIEIVSGRAKLVPTVEGAEAYAYWTMDDNVSDDVFRDLSGNSRDLALKGGLTGNNKVPGKINNGLTGISTTQGFCSGGTIDYNFERTDSFTIEFWIKTTSSSTMSIIAKQNDVSPFDGYGVTILGGKIRGIYRDELGNVISKEHNTIVNDGVFHHIVVPYNGNSDVSGFRVIVDNTENDNIIINNPLTGTMINNKDFQISGRDGNVNCIDADTVVDECVIYDRELTDAEIAFRWNNGNGTQQLPGASTSFPTDNPTIQPQGTLTVTEVTQFLATVIESGADNIRFVFIVNGIDRYWNGTAWADSTVYSESNTAVDLNSNLATLGITDRSSLNWKAYIHSGDGSTTPELVDVTISYKFSSSGIVLEETVITGNVRDIGGNIPAKEITVRAQCYTYGTNLLSTSQPIPVNFDSVTGNFEVSLFFEDTYPDRLLWNFDDMIKDTNFLPGIRKFKELL